MVLFFFTNINSNKGKHFTLNNTLSMCFYWENLKRQIRIIGKGKVCKDTESDEYFSTRVRGSQIGAWASKQSSEIKNRSYLLKCSKSTQKNLRIKLYQGPNIGLELKLYQLNMSFGREESSGCTRERCMFLKKKKLAEKNSITLIFMLP